MVTKELIPGQVVRSKAGRDKGWVFFVISSPEDGHVYVADGDYRRIENPKRKKIKHLQPYNIVNKVISEKLLSGGRPENIELRRELENSGVIEITLEDIQI